MYQADLIFDLGAHTGVDTAFYLAKGFRVVAVEANPVLAAGMAERFAEDIATGRLHVENIGVTDSAGVKPFFVNDVDEWSSFDAALGQRKGRFKTIDVACQPLDYLVEKHGMPYYLKIDIEGFDEPVVRALCRFRERPRYISIEDIGLKGLVALFESRVGGYKFSNQLAIRDLRSPPGTVEGQPVPYNFGTASSGPFGNELGGDWLAPPHAFKYYLDHVRPPGAPPIDGWWDIHGVYPH